VEAVVQVDEVMTFETRGGNVRYVLRDSDGKEYTTFREGIGEAAKRLEGRRARIEVEAAPWLVGESEPHEEVPPEELYEKLKPFKERVAEDIKDRDEEEG
jgi:hypothetical protein